MNIAIGVVQLALAFLCLAGGAYKTFAFDEVAKQLDAIPRGGWAALGVFEMVCGLLLIIPAATKWMPVLTPIGAAALTVETLALCALYARYSLNLTAANPLIWAVAMALLASFVAYGRYSLKSLARRRLWTYPANTT